MEKWACTAYPRPTGVTVPNETPTVISYSLSRLQTWKITDGTLEKWHSYDNMGRLAKLTWSTDGKTLYLDTEQDLLNRTTRIIYPTL